MGATGADVAPAPVTALLFDAFGGGGVARTVVNLANHLAGRRDVELVSLFREFITRSRAVRRLGSAALDLCYVAAGRFDGYWESKIQPWDVAAGALIVAEAGGQVTTVTGGPFRSRSGSVLASNGLIHDRMLEVIVGFGDGRRAPNRTH